jgi:hypothetical protein
MYARLAYAVTPEREPLAIFAAWMWEHKERDKGDVRHGKKQSTR